MLLEQISTTSTVPSTSSIDISTTSRETRSTSLHSSYQPFTTREAARIVPSTNQTVNPHIIDTTTTGKKI